MAEQRQCKECGKLFIPKGRERYCSATHYRPCPICGDPVEAKYLSDPPRKCDNCRRGSKKADSVTPSSKPAAQPKAKPLFSIPSIPSGPKFANPEGPKFANISLPKPSAVAKEEKPAGSINDIDPKLLKSVEAAPDKTIDQAEFCEKLSGSIMTYIGKQIKSNSKSVGFVPGHKYLIKIDRDQYVYRVQSETDLTEGEDCKHIACYASQISFYQHFRKALA